MEQTLVVVPVHRSFLAIKPPTAQLRQRMQDIRDQPPPHLQTFKLLAATHVPSQKNFRLPFQETRVPRHRHPRRYLIHLFHTERTQRPALAVFVGKDQPAVGKHFYNSRREHQITVLVFSETLPVSRRRISGRYRRPPHIITGPSHRIHAIFYLIFRQQRQALRKRSNILRKRNHVLDELR